MKPLSSHLAVSAIALASLALTVPVAAQTFAIAANNAVAQSSGIRYTAGGVGLDARAEMQGLAASHNLLVKFAEVGGEFLVPDSVSVRKGNVDVLTITDSGPLLYVSLPNGTYTVLATYQGVVRSRAVNVSTRTPDVVLTWPVLGQ
jgi:hypothetical protein